MNNDKKFLEPRQVACETVSANSMRTAVEPDQLAESDNCGNLSREDSNTSSQCHTESETNQDSESNEALDHEDVSEVLDSSNDDWDVIDVSPEFYKNFVQAFVSIKTYPRLQSSWDTSSDDDDENLNIVSEKFTEEQSGR